MRWKLDCHFVGHQEKTENPDVLLHHHVRLTQRISCLVNSTMLRLFRKNWLSCAFSVRSRLPLVSTLCLWHFSGVFGF